MLISKHTTTLGRLDTGTLKTSDDVSGDVAKVSSCGVSELGLDAGKFILLVVIFNLGDSGLCYKNYLRTERACSLNAGYAASPIF